MRVRRHFNLARIGHQYDSIEIEVETSDISTAIQQIEEAYRTYCKSIVAGVVT